MTLLARLQSLPFSERRKLIEELHACTRVCFIDDCTNEATHACKSHPHWGYDGDTDYDEADICAAHWGEGVNGLCDACQPEPGCRTLSEHRHHEWMLKVCAPMINGILGDMEARMAAFKEGGMKIGEVANISMPTRFVVRVGQHFVPEPGDVVKMA